MKINGHLAKLEKEYNEFKLQYNKQPLEEVLALKTVKTTIQILYDKGFFDIFQTADKIFIDFLFTKRRRVDLEEVKDVVQ